MGVEGNSREKMKLMIGLMILLIGDTLPKMGKIRNRRKIMP